MILFLITSRKSCDSCYKENLRLNMTTQLNPEWIGAKINHVDVYGEDVRRFYKIQFDSQESIYIYPTSPGSEEDIAILTDSELEIKFRGQKPRKEFMYDGGRKVRITSAWRNCNSVTFGFEDSEFGPSSFWIVQADNSWSTPSYFTGLTDFSHYCNEERREQRMSYSKLCSLDNFFRRPYISKDFRTGGATIPRGSEKEIRENLSKYKVLGIYGSDISNIISLECSPPQFKNIGVDLGEILLTLSWDEEDSPETKNDITTLHRSRFERSKLGALLGYFGNPLTIDFQRSSDNFFSDPKWTKLGSPFHHLIGSNCDDIKIGSNGGVSIYTDMSHVFGAIHFKRNRLDLRMVRTNVELRGESCSHYTNYTQEAIEEIACSTPPIKIIHRLHDEATIDGNNYHRAHLFSTDETQQSLRERITEEFPEVVVQMQGGYFGRVYYTLWTPRIQKAGLDLKVDEFLDDQLGDDFREWDLKKVMEHWRGK